MRSTNIGLLYPKVRNNIGGDISIDVPANQNIGGDVSPAALTPVFDNSADGDSDPSLKLHPSALANSVCGVRVVHVS